MKQTKKQIMGDSEWWQELERYLPWMLCGFTERKTATFKTGCGGYSQITARMRNDILSAMSLYGGYGVK